MKLSVCLVCLVILVTTVILSTKVERFGMSPGTLDQLQSTSVQSQPRPYFLL